MPLSSSVKQCLITIDGPAASGKSSLSSRLAQKLGWVWLSTGVFYRALAWLALNENLQQEDDMARRAGDVSSYIRLGRDQTSFFYKEEDRTPSIYTEEVDRFASGLAKLSKVRAALLPVQRKFLITHPKGLIAEGRDCGTVVFPQAGLKIYLEAQENIRAVRRASQRGFQDVGRVSRLQSRRDQQDALRPHSPLARPKGAFVIDAGKCGLDDMTAQAHRLACKLFTNS